MVNLNCFLLSVSSALLCSAHPSSPLHSTFIRRTKRNDTHSLSSSSQPPAATVHIFMFCSETKPFCLNVVTFCVFQARKISTGELAAVKMIKLEPGEFQLLLVIKRFCPFVCRKHYSSASHDVYLKYSHLVQDSVIT